MRYLNIISFSVGSFISKQPILKSLYKNCIYEDNGKNVTPTTTTTKKGVSRLWHKTASHCEAPVLEIWEEKSISSLSLLPGPLLPGVGVTVKIPSMGEIDLFKNYLKGSCAYKNLLRKHRYILYPGLFVKTLLLGKNSLVVPIPLQVYNWFEFRVFLLLYQLPYQG